MKTPLSKVYLDDYPIELMGDEARPPLARIVRAAGKIPARVDIIWLDARSDSNGAPVDPEEFIDRTSDPTRPIYLRSLPRLPAPGDGPVASVPAPPLKARRESTTTDATSGTLSGPVTSHSNVQGPVPLAPDPDPVISQLGKPPRTERDVAAANRETVPVALRKVPADAPPKSPPVLARGAQTPAALSRKLQRDAKQASAEAEAEGHQEEQRNQEDTLQDADEARMDAEDDAEKAD